MTPLGPINMPKYLVLKGSNVFRGPLASENVPYAGVVVSSRTSV